MTKKLTIVVPVFGKEVAHVSIDAVNSILMQITEYDYSVIISNNGGSKNVRDIYTSKKYMSKVQYFETARKLTMPEHFEWASSQVTSEYLMILPARRVLKQGSISKMIDVMEENQDCDACCGTYEEWDESCRRLFGSDNFSPDKIVDSSELLDKFLYGEYSSRSEFWSSLPTSMNGIIRNKFISKLRDKYSFEYFEPVNPDVLSGFKCLLNSKKIYLIGSPVFITTNRSVSGGNKSIMSFESAYLSSLGKEGVFRHVPPELNDSIYASIIEDYNRQKKIFVYNKFGLHHINELSSYFIGEVAFEFYLKILNNPFNFSRLKKVFIASMYILKIKKSIWLLLRKLIFAFVVTLYLKSPKFIKNLLSAFRGRSVMYDGVYSAAGFSNESIEMLTL